MIGLRSLRRLARAGSSVFDAHADISLGWVWVCIHLFLYLCTIKNGRAAAFITLFEVLQGHLLVWSDYGVSCAANVCVGHLVIKQAIMHS